MYSLCQGLVIRPSKAFTRPNRNVASEAKTLFNQDTTHAVQEQLRLLKMKQKAARYADLCEEHLKEVRFLVHAGGLRE